MKTHDTEASKDSRASLHVYLPFSSSILSLAFHVFLFLVLPNTVQYSTVQYSTFVTTRVIVRIIIIQSYSLFKLKINSTVSVCGTKRTGEADCQRSRTPGNREGEVR